MTPLWGSPARPYSRSQKPGAPSRSTGGSRRGGRRGQSRPGPLRSLWKTGEQRQRLSPTPCPVPSQKLPLDFYPNLRNSQAWRRPGTPRGHRINQEPQGKKSTGNPVQPFPERSPFPCPTPEMIPDSGKSPHPQPIPFSISPLPAPTTPSQLGPGAAKRPHGAPGSCRDGNSMGTGIPAGTRPPLTLEVAQGHHVGDGAGRGRAWVAPVAK